MVASRACPQARPPRRSSATEFVARLAERAQEAEELRRLPAATVADLIASGFTELLVPARYGGMQADFPAILDPVRRMAHGCASSAWTIGFYALHNWMLALFDERAQDEAFATRPFLAPAPLAPTGRGVPVDGGIRLTGRWSWATGVMDGNWIIVGALCGPDDGDLSGPGAAARRRLRDRGRLAHRRHARHRLQRRRHHRRVRPRAPARAGRRHLRAAPRRAPRCTTPTPTAGRWCPRWRCLAAMPALGSAERVAEIYAERLAERVLAYEGVTQKDKPIAQAHLGEARVRLRALRGLLADTVGEIETIVAAGDPVPRRYAARPGWPPRTSCTSRGPSSATFSRPPGPARTSSTTRCNGSSATSTSSAGHVVFDYDTSRELAGALTLGMKIPRTAMV